MREVNTNRYVCVILQKYKYTTHADTFPLVQVRQMIAILYYLSI